jgi:putative ABC transport system permease protein
MYGRAILNDIARSRVITLTTMLFITAAALLVSLAAILGVNLSGAIDTLMTRSETPHFMQMHSGALDRERLEAFAAQHEEVEKFQVAEFLNMEGSRIIFEGGSLAGSVQDNGFTVQGEKFDYLVDLDGKPIRVSEGELYVPLTYGQTGLVKPGEKVQVADRIFIVAGFLRDSQMNSLLSSSKRFLVSQEDFEALRNRGTMEYLIEFRLHDLTALGSFEASYGSAGLEANGPTITYPLFRIMNALSDGLMIAVILLVSALVVAVAFLCIRFTLLAKIEEDYREIGVMKAIGLRTGDIRKIYLIKYAAIAAAGSLLGYGLSFFFRDALLEDIRLFMGESENSFLAPLLAAGGVALVFLVITAYVNGVLGRFRNISPAQAVRFGISQEKPRGRMSLPLNPVFILDTNALLGIKDVLAAKKLYATMLAVLVLAAFIIIVPRNLYHTISSENFLTHMGTGKSDLRIDIQQTDHIAKKTAEIAVALEKDPAITRHAVLTAKAFKAKRDDGLEQRLRVDLGDHSIFPLAYTQGRGPVTEGEIALSVMNARELDKQTGDPLTLIVEGKEKRLTVSGLYSDVTNGGKTAKAVFNDSTAPIMGTMISAEIADAALIDRTAAAYAGRFGFAKVSGIEEFIRQTYGPTIGSIGKASYAAAAASLTITMLITLLFMRMLIARDRYPIAVMKTLGFTNSDIRKQYAARALFVLVAGIILGTVLANTLGEALAGAMIASLGAASFNFTVNPLESYLMAPLLLGTVVLVSTALGTLDAGKIRISENIKE